MFWFIFGKITLINYFIVLWIYNTSNCPSCTGHLQLTPKSDVWDIELNFFYIYLILFCRLVSCTGSKQRLEMSLWSLQSLVFLFIQYPPPLLAATYKAAQKKKKKIEASSQFVYASRPTLLLCLMYRTAETLAGALKVQTGYHGGQRDCCPHVFCGDEH